MADEIRRSAQLRLENYDSDKVPHNYLARYDNEFSELVEKPIKLLEMGVYRGGSLMLWRDYFPAGEIVGIDLYPPQNFPSADRVYIYKGNQGDMKFLSQVAHERAPQGFDIIIDDASHMGELTKIAFWHLFDNHLRPGGIYAIEDWGTGYCDDWPDGKSLDLKQNETAKIGPKYPWYCHSYGMVGLVKQLIDEQCAADVSRKLLSGKPNRWSRFESMVITPSIVFIRKAGKSY